MSDVETGTIRTRIPARLDRLPWSRFHWRVVVGLGTVWILDGLEVTIVGSIAARLTEKGSGIAMTASDIGVAAAVYVAGACFGALFFGQLTDRFGRKKLFMLTLGVYLLATVATAFAFAPWYFFLCRFFAGAGIGGEYAAINSAIDELIPARNRGQVDITINGSYWLGAAMGALAAVLFLNTSIFPADLGWRLSFAMGAIFGIAILIVRRHVPESPRWLFIHGREEEAERIVDAIEASVRDETQQQLSEPGKEIAVRQRERIPFREIAKVAFERYPKRALLGLALFVGQAFLYNAVTFDLGTILSEYFDVASGAVPYFILIFAAGNFLGPLLLGRLFDTVGRKPMIAGTYLIASVSTALLGILLLGDGLTQWSFIAMVGVTFFFASAGASSAYLTVSELFPMETRALAIAFFYAIGTAAGGITGPLLFGHLIDSGETATVAVGFFIGAGVMALGGIAELAFGVRAENASLEDIATPLTVADEPGEQTREPAPLASEPRDGLARAGERRAEEEPEGAAEAGPAVEELARAEERRGVEERVPAAEAGPAVEELERAEERRGVEEPVPAAEAGRAVEELERAEERRAVMAELGRAAEERVSAARQRAKAEALEREGAVVASREARLEAGEREREAQEREQRIRDRLARQRERDLSGRARFRPGPGASLYSPGMVGTASRWAPAADEDLDREIDVIARALAERGATDRDALARAVGARYWGPGRFRRALREAVEEGRARRVSRGSYAPRE